MSSTAAALLALILIGALLVEAQPGAPKGGKGAGETVDQFVAKLMAFNKAKDGKLTKQELTDTRLHALFDRADADKNGTVTRPELEALFAKEALPAGGFGEKGKGPPDKKGPPKKKGPPPMLVT
jgi:hypothetical protein